MRSTSCRRWVQKPKWQCPSSTRSATPQLFQFLQQLWLQPERPGPGNKHIGGDQPIGGGVGQHRIAQVPAAIKDPCVSHSGSNSREPAVVQKTKQQRRGYKREPRKANRWHVLEIGPLQS